VLVSAWKAGDATARERIVDEPLLFLKTEEALGDEVDREASLLDDLEAVAGCCRRARKHVRDGAVGRLAHRRDALIRAWTESSLAFAGLVDLLREEGIDAGRADANSDPATGA
jgi:hypothetical protein